MHRTLPVIASLAALLFMGCGSSGSKSSSPSKPTPRQARVANQVASELVQRGHLLICSDVPSPPQEFYDKNSKLVGSDIDVGQELARRMGLRVTWVNSVFDTIIAAANSGKCDIVISGQNITPERQKQVFQVPYFRAGQTFVVKKGNSTGITSDTASLCGKTLAVQLGALEQTTAQGFSKKCTRSGKKAIKLVVAQKSSEALQQVQTGHADAFFQDSPVGAYYVKQQPQVFETAGRVIEPVAEGIGIPKTKPKLHSAIQQAFSAMRSDGTNDRILRKWGVQAGKL